MFQEFKKRPRKTVMKALKPEKLSDEDLREKTKAINKLLEVQNGGR
jgi:hypothetical protein